MDVGLPHDLIGKHIDIEHTDFKESVYLFDIHTDAFSPYGVLTGVNELLSVPSLGLSSGWVHDGSFWVHFAPVLGVSGQIGLNDLDKQFSNAGEDQRLSPGHISSFL